MLLFEQLNDITDPQTDGAPFIDYIEDFLHPSFLPFIVFLWAIFLVAFIIKKINEMF